MDPSKLVPLLVPLDFDDPGVVRVQLVPGSEASPYVVLALEHAQFWELAQAPFGFAEHRTSALRNLRARAARAEWHRLSMDGNDGPVDVLVREGDETTASDLFDAAFLERTRKELGAEEILLAAPTRSALVASTDATVIGRLCLVRIEEYGDDEFVIGPQLYRFDGGELGVVGLLAERGGQPPNLEPMRRNRASARRVLLPPRRVIAFDDPPDANEDYDERVGYVPRGTWIETATGEIAILLALSEPDLASAAKKIELVVEKRLDWYAKRPAFRGEIRFQLDPAAVRRTKANRLELERILKRKNAELAERGARTVSGDAVFVSGSIGAPRDRSAEEGPSAAPEPAEDPAEIERRRGVAEAERAEAEAERARRAEAAEAQRAAEERRALELAPLRRKLALGGALVATVCGFGRVAVAATTPGGQWTPGAAWVAPVVSAVLLLAVVCRVGLGGAVLLGMSLVATFQSLVRFGLAATREAPAWIVSVNFASSLLFLAATVLLATGSTLRRLPSVPSTAGGPTLALGAALGCLLQVFTGLADISSCRTRLTPKLGTLERNAYRPRSCADLPAAACSKVPGCRVTAPTCASDCSTRSEATCRKPICAWQDGRCAPRQCHWETHKYRSDLDATYRACEPEGGCFTDGKTICVEPCSAPKTRQECDAALVCTFHECEGTPARSCEQLSALECIPELCTAARY